MTLYITPERQLRIQKAELQELKLSKAASLRLHKAFAQSTAAGLIHLATDLLDTTLTPNLHWARDYAQHYLSCLCQATVADGGALDVDVPIPLIAELDQRMVHVPPMLGHEYLSIETLSGWWVAMHTCVHAMAGSQGILFYLESRNRAWHSVGRVSLHLAENTRSDEYPFAFLATFVDGVSTEGSARHVPLSKAIEATASAEAHTELLGLLTPIQRAADQLPWLSTLVESGALYKPLAWTAEKAHEFLQSVDELQRAGLTVRTPDWWHGKRVTRPRVVVSVGTTTTLGVGLEAMLDFSVTLAIDGDALSHAELHQLLNENEGDDAAGLVQLRGRWVELDRRRLNEVLAHWKSAEEEAREGVNFAEAMRWMAGAQALDSNTKEPDATNAEWVGIKPGVWLEKTLAQLRDPSSLKTVRTPGLKAKLRPYQSTGVSWLRMMSSLQLGACLADDMGLGKTIQVIALLLHIKRADDSSKSNAQTNAQTDVQTITASLLIVPASLVGNWRAEIDRFAPSLQVATLHPSDPSVDISDDQAVQKAVVSSNLVVTTYSMISRLEVLHKCNWHVLILDEAQAIKNASTRQSRTIKQLNSQMRIALTGTPVENNLSDLWSLFDFLNPGLLGNISAFKKFVKYMSSGETQDYSPLRRLVAPYILRRLKTDKRVIDDLPEKTEVRQFCGLTKLQAQLYQRSVRELARQLSEADGMQRRGLVFSYLMRFKQICNHPAQWQGTGAFPLEESAKFRRLATLCTEFAQRQERVLVFTQFREITEPLAKLLTEVFGKPGLVLHGGTPVKRRQAMVRSFQDTDGPPFFILSLKAGGTGLNLTAASQVVHFDRWWNPAVENQATDRAFRIGQKNNVLVHKFVCRGTIEERIDAMIADKMALADAVLDTDSGKLITEMNDEELLQFVALDVHKAMET